VNKALIIAANAEKSIRQMRRSDVKRGRSIL
jgi:hypothetical protein